MLTISYKVNKQEQLEKKTEERSIGENPVVDPN